MCDSFASARVIENPFSSESGGPLWDLRHSSLKGGLKGTATTVEPPTAVDELLVNRPEDYNRIDSANRRYREKASPAITMITAM